MWYCSIAALEARKTHALVV